jgi:hypothetical protein
MIRCALKNGSSMHSCWWEVCQKRSRFGAMCGSPTFLRSPKNDDVDWRWCCVGWVRWYAGINTSSTSSVPPSTHTIFFSFSSKTDLEGYHGMSLWCLCQTPTSINLVPGRSKITIRNDVYVQRPSRSDLNSLEGMKEKSWCVPPARLRSKRSGPLTFMSGTPGSPLHTK